MFAEQTKPLINEPRNLISGTIVLAKDTDIERELNSLGLFTEQHSVHNVFQINKRIYPLCIEREILIEMENRIITLKTSSSFLDPSKKVLTLAFEFTEDYNQRILGIRNTTQNYLSLSNEEQTDVFDFLKSLSLLIDSINLEYVIKIRPSELKRQRVYGKYIEKFVRTKDRVQMLSVLRES